MNNPSISNDLELAEKALEVMGWEQFRWSRIGPTHRNTEGRQIQLRPNDPLSNDLAAEGKRWLEDRCDKLIYSSFVYTGGRFRGLDCWVDGVFKTRQYCPTENEAVLRAVVEIGTREQTS